MHSRDAGGRGCQNILRTSKLVVPAHAGTQGQATEIPGFPLSRERWVYFATVDAGGPPVSTRAEEPSRKDGPPQFFCCAIRSGSLPGNCDELVAVGVTKISEISAIRALARRI